MSLSDDFLLSLVECAPVPNIDAYVQVHVINGRLVIRYEDATTHEVTVRKWSLTPVEREAA